MSPKLDMHNRVTGAQLETLLGLQLDALERNPSLAKVLPSLMVWGAPGLGKCIWCGSTSTGAGCQYSPTRRHER